MNTNSQLNNSNGSLAEGIVRRALADLGQEWARPELANSTLDDDMFDQIDSFAIVELLMRTESEVEESVGRYIPLASDEVLDADKSPLRRLGDWVAYVEKAITDG